MDEKSYGSSILGTAGPRGGQGWGWHQGSLAPSPAMRGRAWEQLRDPLPQ